MPSATRAVERFGGWLAIATLLGACAADASGSGLELAESADAGQELGELAQGVTAGVLRLNDVYYVTATPGFDGANMFATASSTAITRRLAPQAAVKIVIAEPSSESRYRVDHAGTLGWIAGEDLNFRHAYNPKLSETRINALARARVAMGFSYWWSNARWSTAGATMFPVLNKGRCTGVCAHCTHAATGGGEEYGADCSGFVSTIWGFPDFDPDTNPTNNGFSTEAFMRDTAKWKTIPLASAQAGDAVVRFDDMEKHIVLLATSRIGMETFHTYECRGCNYGCQTFKRVFPANGMWHAIRRKGW